MKYLPDYQHALLQMLFVLFFFSLNDAGRGEGMLFRHTCLRMAMRSFKEMYVVA